MKNGEVKFAYEKLEDGSLRYAVGTLKGIPDGAIKNGEFRDRDWHRHYKTIPYWDVEANEFRSFKAHLFIKAYGEDEPSIKHPGVNIEISGYEGDGSLTTTYHITEVLKNAGFKVNTHVPQKDANIDYDAIKVRSLADTTKLLSKVVMNVTYTRKKKYNTNKKE
jgi:hypothetical protein